MIAKLGGVVTLALLIMVAGCGVQKDATYKSAADLKGAMVQAGYTCPSWSDAEPQTDKPVPFDSGSCLSDNRDQVMVFPDQKSREENLEGIILGTQMVSAGGRVEMVLLVGPNWMIRGPAEEVRALQPRLGGYFPDLTSVRIPGLGNF